MKLEEFGGKSAFSLLPFRISCRLEERKVKGTSLLGCFSSAHRDVCCRLWFTVPF